MVLLYTVAKETHLIIPEKWKYLKFLNYSAALKLRTLKEARSFLPRATSGPQWHSLEHRDKHIVTYSDMVLVLCYINISINISSTDIIQLQRT